MYRLQDSVNGARYATVGAVKRSTHREVAVEPGKRTTHRFRVIPYDAFEVQGFTATGSTLRVTAKSERPSSLLTYTGAWSTAADPGYLGGRARRASSPSARATYAFTGREVAWVAAKGRRYGRATVIVDGVARGTIDLDAPKSRLRRVVFRATWAGPGATPWSTNTSTPAQRTSWRRSSRL